jgi:hypothetical protein
MNGESLDSYAQSVVSGYTYDLYVMNADGSGVRRLTRLAGRTRPQPRHQRSVDQAAPLWSRRRLGGRRTIVPSRKPECAVRSPRRNEFAFYRAVDTDVGAGGGFGMLGIICVETAAGKPETLTQGLGKPCPDTRVS